MKIKSVRVAIVFTLAVPVLIYYVAYRRGDHVVVMETGRKDPLEFDSFETNTLNTSCKSLSSQNIYSYTSSKWNYNKDVCNGCFNFIKTRLKTPFGDTPIYVYEAKRDVFVSAALIKHGTFDKEKVNQLFEFFRLDPTLNFIDIGANIGVISLNVAKLGRKVLAIEALYSNVQRLCYSIKSGGFEDNLTVIHNALSDKAGVEVNLGVDINNMGGTFVDLDAQHTKNVKKNFQLKIGGSYGKVQTVTLDDLLKFEKIKDFKNVIIKIDIEGFEYRALQGANMFFNIVNVKALFMEWVFHRNRTSGKGIIDFMTERNFKPYTENGKQLLAVSQSASWPLNILWLPK